MKVTVFFAVFFAPVVLAAGQPTSAPTEKPAAVAAPASTGAEALEREIGETRLKRLVSRLDELNRDIATKGILRVDGQTKPLLTGYAYKP